MVDQINFHGSFDEMNGTNFFSNGADESSVLPQNTTINPNLSKRMSHEAVGLEPSDR